MARLLVIDDEKLARLTLRKILERAGHEIVEATTGVEGLKKFRSHAPFDLIVTDIIMPDKEGIETIIEIKTENPTTPIIAMSGGGRTRNLDFLKLAVQHGAERVLAKPFSQTDILDAVNALLAPTAPATA